MQSSLFPCGERKSAGVCLGGAVAGSLAISIEKLHIVPMHDFNVNKRAKHFSNL